MRQTKVKHHACKAMVLFLCGAAGYASIVTDAEFVAGLILNVWLKLKIWDYSSIPGNVLGQICPQYTLAWLGLSLVAIILDDWLRYLLFDEDRPHYRLF